MHLGRCGNFRGFRSPRRILKKLEFYAAQSDPMRFAKRLEIYSAYRFRIGAYRVIFQITGDELHILKIGKRSDIYEDL